MKAITSQFVVLLSSLRVVKASVPTGIAFNISSLFFFNYSAKAGGVMFLFVLSVCHSVCEQDRPNW